MTDTAADPALEARYGRTPARRRRARWMLWALAGAIVATVTVWVVWAGLFVPAASLQVTTTGYRVDAAASTVEVRWRMTLDRSVEARCAVQALDESHSIIGWKIVDIPASDRHTRAFTETIRTTEPANTGLIDRCWVE